MARATPKPIFFAAPAEFRRWLATHHRRAGELWVGFHKRATGKPSLTWAESVDEVLCVGWIDGIRKRIDEERYMIRFTPRRSRSIWSAVNIKRVAVLVEGGRMRPAGVKAFEARQENRSGIYAYEQRSERLPAPYARVLKANATAWRFFQSQPPWYRKTIGWWIVSAKREETRLRRLRVLADLSAQGKVLPQLERTRRKG